MSRLWQRQQLQQHPDHVEPRRLQRPWPGRRSARRIRRLTFNSLNLTGRTCMPYPDGDDDNLGSALYDCSYDPTTSLSTIVVVFWPSHGGGPTNPTCDLSPGQWTNPLGGGRSWLLPL